jgi:hypothetical protein
LGQNQGIKCFGVVQALNSSSGGTSTTRSNTKSNSFFIIVLLRRKDMGVQLIQAAGVEFRGIEDSVFGGLQAF